MSDEELIEKLTDAIYEHEREADQGGWHDPSYETIAKVFLEAYREHTAPAGDERLIEALESLTGPDTWEYGVRAQSGRDYYRGPREEAETSVGYFAKHGVAATLMRRRPVGPWEVCDE